MFRPAHHPFHHTGHYSSGKSASLSLLLLSYDMLYRNNLSPLIANSGESNDQKDPPAGLGTRHGASQRPGVRSRQS
ncbi:hypothetical protein KQQSB11_10089 [Klebsiella quasipneumoniae subsp. quasipneumoniae]|nr:hypothetical protein KQQSB11_10089 [Klebsiella quasipneumoniae subsp. quasipneumoniae]